MRLCDRDIEAWLDEGRLSITPRPPVERINGVTVDVRLGNKFRTFSGHTAPFIDLSGPKDEVSAALDRVMSDEIVIDEGDPPFVVGMRNDRDRIGVRTLDIGDRLVVAHGHSCRLGRQKKHKRAAQPGPASF